MSLPWPARFAAASAPTLSRAYRIFCDYGDPTDQNEIDRALVDFAADSDLIDYQNRNEAARIAAMSDAEVSDELFTNPLEQARIVADVQYPPLTNPWQPETD